MGVTNDIIYVGVNDHKIDLFEGQYVVPNGMAYNSYVILDEKIAIMDTVDRNFTHEWLDNVAEALAGCDAPAPSRYCSGLTGGRCFFACGNSSSTIRASVAASAANFTSFIRRVFVKRIDSSTRSRIMLSTSLPT